MAACKLWAHAVYGSKHPLFDSPPQAGCLLWVRYPLSKLSHRIVKWGWPCLSSCTVTGRILNTKLFRGYQATIEPPPPSLTLFSRGWVAFPQPCSLMKLFRTWVPVILHDECQLLFITLSAHLATARTLLCLPSQHQLLEEGRMSRESVRLSCFLVKGKMLKAYIPVP